MTKFQSKRFVSGCGEQSEFLRRKTENPISFSDVRNIGVLLKRLGARFKIIREVARRAEKGYLRKKRVKMKRRKLKGYIYEKARMFFTSTYKRK